MERRKIQLIAGSTYTVSLPKSWVIKNNLKEKSQISITENNDRTLVLSSDLPSIIITSKFFTVCWDKSVRISGK